MKSTNATPTRQPDLAILRQRFAERGNTTMVRRLDQQIAQRQHTTAIITRAARATG